ncbi:hypothetical protein BDI4_190131 [Burkholderia diffusa]|nr:hypothetical protein BDI4_190131 [Burkholderia diffusa]
MRKHRRVLASPAEGRESRGRAGFAAGAGVRSSDPAPGKSQSPPRLPASLNGSFLMHRPPTA